MLCITISSTILVFLINSAQCCRHATTTSVANNSYADDNATNSSGLQNPCMTLEPNDYVDGLIMNLKNKTIDTIPLPDEPGLTSLTEGRVWGLGSLKRIGDAMVRCNETLTTIEVLLSFEELKGRYKWERKVLSSTFSGSVNIKADTAVILFRVSQQRGNDTGLKLEELTIKDLSGIHTDVTGLGVVTWAISVITQPAANLFKKSLARMVEGPLKDATGVALSNIDFPLN